MARSESERSVECVLRSARRQRAAAPSRAVGGAEGARRVRQVHRHFGILEEATDPHPQRGQPTRPRPGLHSWLRTRQKSADQARPRTYLTRHRRAMLEGAFASIDRDDSGEIDRHELCFALEQLGLNADLANAIMDEGDANGDGRLDLEEFMALVQKLNAREIRMELLDARERRRASKGKAAIGGDSAVVVDPLASTCAASASARHRIGGVGGGGGRGGGGSSSTAATHRSREVRAQRSGGATSRS